MKKIKQRGLASVPSVFSLSIPNADQETSSRSTSKKTASPKDAKVLLLQDREIAAANKNFIKQTYRIARTAAGRSFFLELASQAPVGADLILLRQNFIKSLQAQPAVLKKIRQILTAIYAQEKDAQGDVSNFLSLASELKGVLCSSTSLYEAYAGVCCSKSAVGVEMSNDVFSQEISKKPAIAVNFYAEIDVYASIAARMLAVNKDLSKKAANYAYCFAELDTVARESFIAAENVWGPAPNTTIPQSIYLGTDSLRPRTTVRILRTNNRVRENFLLSTVPYNVLLAQILGVACAASFKFTPFSKILARVPLKEVVAPASFKGSVTNYVSLASFFETLGVDKNAFVVTDMGSFFEPSIQDMLVNAATAMSEKPNIVCVHVLRKEPDPAFR
jgi:hypothetical protein